MQKTVSQAIVEVLLKRHVEMIFGMPGSHINALYSALSTTSIRHVTVKHENNGAVMADVH